MSKAPKKQKETAAEIDKQRRQAAARRKIAEGNASCVHPADIGLLTLEEQIEVHKQSATEARRRWIKESDDQRLQIKQLEARLALARQMIEAVVGRNADGVAKGLSDDDMPF